MNGQAVTSRVAVRPADLDSLGHVNNARLLEYLEAGRWSWLDAHGVRERSNVVPVVSSIRIDYLGQIRFTHVDVETLILPLPEPDLELAFRVRFEQRVSLVEPRTLVAKATIDVAFVHLVSHALCPVEDFVTSHPEARLRQYLVPQGDAA
jgi:acyl-CoA thioester hydrolase